MRKVTHFTDYEAWKAAVVAHGATAFVPATGSIVAQVGPRGAAIGGWWFAYKGQPAKGTLEEWV